MLKSVKEIAKLAKGSINLRQQAIATAHVYIKRFYTKVEIRRTNPHLVMATAVYLACKMEECPQHIRVILGEARHNWTGECFSQELLAGQGTLK